MLELRQNIIIDFGVNLIIGSLSKATYEIGRRRRHSFTSKAVVHCFAAIDSSLPVRKCCPLSLPWPRQYSDNMAKIRYERRQKKEPKEDVIWIYGALFFPNPSKVRVSIYKEQKINP